MHLNDLELYKLRVKKYLQNLKLYISKLLQDPRVSSILEEYPELLTNIKLYLKDAEQLFSQGNWFSALVAIVYAEGLLDSLKFIGKLESEWPSKQPELLRCLLVTKNGCRNKELLITAKLLYPIGLLTVALLGGSSEEKELCQAIRYLERVEIVNDLETLVSLSRGYDLVIFLDQETFTSLSDKLLAPAIYIEIKGEKNGAHSEDLNCS